MLFKIDRMRSEEMRAIERIEGLREDLRWATHDARRWTGLLRRSLFARAIQGSNSIEGYNVSVDDAIAAMEGEEPLNATSENWRATIGYRNAMTYVLQLAEDRFFHYSEGLIRGLHFMIMQYDLSKNPGLWRPGVIYVRHEPSQKIVYEGPPAEQVPALMAELIGALEDKGDAHALVRGAMGHLNLAMIHPFSDGNGRMARCLQTLILAREKILAPEFCSIEEYLGRNTEDYYRVLAEVGQGSWHPMNDARPWIRFCLLAHYRQAQKVLHRAREYARVWNELDAVVSRLGLNERTILALHDATFGYRVRNSTYRAAAEISINLASRDLKDLADNGLLVSHGQGANRYYTASKPLHAIREKTREPEANDDPFSEAPRQGALPIPPARVTTQPLLKIQVAATPSTSTATLAASGTASQVIAPTATMRKPTKPGKE